MSEESRGGAGAGGGGVPAAEGAATADIRVGTVRSVEVMTAEAAERAGDRVGPYVLLEPLGEGGFGSVWLAERREPYVQRVAVKIIKPGMDSRQVLARFEQERQALAVMDHPNIAKVLDGGITPLGRPYFVMELVKGEPITEFCDRHTLSIHERLEIFVDVCEAVQHAHLKGIIHRDLKPGNVLVSGGKPLRAADDGTGGGGGAVVKVIDFGVAKAAAKTLTEKMVFTEHGQVIGTPEYMSPEQAEMGALDVDARTDVYSLGVLLYELLTGALPFEPRELRSKGYREIQRIIREVEPPKPSTRLTALEHEVKEALRVRSGGSGAKVNAGAGDEEPPQLVMDWARPRKSAAEIAANRRTVVGELVRELRRELDWVPLMAMRKDRRERYQSPAAMAADVRNYLRGLPLVAGPRSAGYRARKFVGRHRAGLGFAAVVAALLGALGVSSYVQAVTRLGIEKAGTARLEVERDGARRQAYAANIAAAGADVELGNVGEALHRLNDCPEDLRGWEWGHLKWRADPSVIAAVLDRPCRSLVLENGGRKVAAVLDSGVVAVDLSNGETERVRTLAPEQMGEGGGAESCSADGTIVVVQPMSSGKRTGLSVVRTKDSEAVALKAGAWKTQTVSVAPWGSRVLVSHIGESPAQRGLSLYDTGTGDSVWEGADAYESAWAPSGKKFVTLGPGGLVVRSAEDGSKVDDIALPPGRGAAPYRIASSADASVVAFADSDGVWEVQKAGGDLTRLSPEGELVAVSEAGRCVAWAVRSEVMVRSTASGRVSRIPMGSNVLAVAIRDDGPLLVTALKNGSVRAINLGSMSPLDWGATPMPAITGVVGAPYSDSFAAGVWSRECGLLCAVGSGSRVSVTGVSGWCGVRGDGSGFFGEGGDAMAWVPWRGGGDAPEIARPAFEKSLAGIGRVVGAAGLGAQEPVWLATQGAGGKGGIVRVSVTGDATREYEFAGIGTPLVVQSRVATVGALQDEIVAWAGESEKPARIVRLDHGVSALVFDEHGARIACGTYNGAVVVIDDLAKSPAREFKGSHSGIVRSAAFTRDAKRLLTGSDDGLVMVWDVETGETLAAFSMGSPVLHLCFPEAGDRGLAVMADGSVKWLGVAEREKTVKTQ